MAGPIKNSKKQSAAKKSAVKKSAASGKSSLPSKKSPAQKEGGGESGESATPDFPIVGIGASAGGLEALEELFDQMPDDTGMAFVVITHQHPGHTSMLAELLGKRTRMPVLDAQDGMKLVPNHVYVGQPGGYLELLHGALHRTEAEIKTAPKLPIDHFFRSIAQDQNTNAICIVLSGTGTDGTLGLKAVKGESGMVMVQQPQSAKYAGMPSSAIATGLADYVLAPAAMPRQLIAYAKASHLGRKAGAKELGIPPEAKQRIFLLLRSHTGHDFSSYKENTINRRIERRMNVHQIDKPGEYASYLRENPHEIDALFKELLITVTNFFRDPESWKSLAQHLKGLIRQRPDNYVLRAWVPGCATGEEAFTLAILLRESMDELKRGLEVQVFGTDLDTEAIETARAGQYPEGIAVDLTPERLDRYFLREDSGYRIRKNIRELAIFAPQNMIKDPPFTKLDILSCRNLLIYLSTDLQKKLLPIFHYALKPGGLLFLGPSESIGSFTNLFEPLDKRWKIYRRKENPTAVYSLPEIPAQPYVADNDKAVQAVISPMRKPEQLSVLIERLLLKRFAPASVVVNQQGDIIYIHGRTGAYLEPTPGRPRNNVLEMAREGLQIELAAALRESSKSGKETVREDIRVRTNGEFMRINFSVLKINEPESLSGLLLVTFIPKPQIPQKASGKNKGVKTTVDSDRIVQLEDELKYMKESHQTTLEELETSNEELKSTNEELQSTNEELQSTNEELETSKEEMQSLNEELTTVNTELQSKVEELSQANDDMQNLLNSTDIATVFLDDDLSIKRFTEQAKELVSLRQTDIGRPISDLASNLKIENLTEECSSVLKTLVFREAEVQTKNGGTYMMKIMPYRTAENVIDGLVLTFVNIGPMKQALKSSEARAYFESIVETVREPLLVLDKDLRVVSANNAFYHLFELKQKQTEGKPVYELPGGQWEIPKLRTLLEEILPQNSKFEDYQVNIELPGRGRRSFSLNARRLKQEPDKTELILLAMEDVTSSN